MASGTLTSKPDQVTVGEQITLTIAISGFNNNTVALGADNDPGDTTDWRTVNLDANGAATVTVTAANAGSFTFTLQLDGSAATDSNGQPITAGPVTVNAPTTTQAPPPTTTTAAAAAPSSTTTAAAAPPTTTTAAAPSSTTTAAPAPSSTTTVSAAPSSTTTATAAPSSTTTATAAPSSTTTATAAPSSTTTGGGPSSTTTAMPSGGGPTVGEVTVKIDPDDGADQHAHSIQVATDAKITLTWSTQNATGVKIDPLGPLGPNDSTELPARNASYSITAVDDSGAASTPYLLEIHTHEPGEAVSPHIDVKSGVAASTTTAPPSTTTAPASTTTAPASTTTAAPQTTTTQAPATSTTQGPPKTTTAQGSGSLTVQGFLSFSTFMLVDESGTPITIDGKNGITTTAIPFGEQMFMFGADGTAKFDGLPAGKYNVVYPTEQDPSDGPPEANPEPVPAGDTPVKIPIDNLLNTGFVASVELAATGEPKTVSIEVTADTHPSACC